MKPLVTQKIRFGVRLEEDEIVSERQKPGKGGDGGGSGEREMKRARSAFPPSAGICRAPIRTTDLDPKMCAAFSPSLTTCPPFTLHLKIKISLFYVCIIEKFYFRCSIYNNRQHIPHEVRL